MKGGWRCPLHSHILVMTSGTFSFSSSQEKFFSGLLNILEIKTCLVNFHLKLDMQAFMST